MKATELRIGNRIDYNGNHHSFDGTFNEEFARYMFDVKDEWEFLQPIPLTEEWLLKFGFEKSSNHNNTNLHLVKYGIYFSIDKGKNIDNTLHGEVYYHTKTLVKIQHVHQLQNLYFALTGEEISLTDKPQGLSAQE